MEQLLLFDEILFFWINGLDIPWLNASVPILRHRFFWTPIYVFFTAFVVINFKFRGLWFLFFAVACIALVDNTSSQWVKKSVKRLRPCKAEHMKSEVLMRIECGSGYSMPSSHAANHMAFAIFMILGLKQIFRRLKYVLIPWAICIGIAQIYVGVHYPSDVLAGFILGGAIGYAMSLLYRRFIRLRPDLAQIQSPEQQ